MRFAVPLRRSNSLDDARADYLRSVLIFLAVSVLGATFMAADGERASAHLKAVVDRTFAAAIESGAEELMRSDSSIN